MKALKYAVGFLEAALISGSALAENIAILDSKSIITSSTAYKNITQLPETKYKAQRDKIEKMREDYTTALSNLNNTKLTKKDQDYKTQEQSLEQQRQALATAQRDFGKQVSEDQNTQMKALFDKFQTIVDNYAKAQKIDLVLNKYAVISSTSKKMDITTTIQQKFEKATT